MWMKDTLLPLDMIFIDASGKIINIAQNARPMDETIIPSGGFRPMFWSWQGAKQSGFIWRLATRSAGRRFPIKPRIERRSLRSACACYRRPTCEPRIDCGNLTGWGGT